MLVAKKKLVVFFKALVLNIKVKIMYSFICTFLFIVIYKLYACYRVLFFFLDFCGLAGISDVFNEFI